MDALYTEKAILGRFDWESVFVNVVTALWPERCNRIVAANSYVIQKHDAAWVP
jgi:hypothetical protein